MLFQPMWLKQRFLLLRRFEDYLFAGVASIAPGLPLALAFFCHLARRCAKKRPARPKKTDIRASQYYICPVSLRKRAATKSSSGKRPIHAAHDIRQAQEQQGWTSLPVVQCKGGHWTLRPPRAAKRPAAGGHHLKHPGPAWQSR